jgi:hypothetical protein
MIIPVLALAISIGLTSPAKATLIDSGDPVEGDSWGQQFNESGIGDFNKVEAFILEGPSFEDPGFRILSSGWNTELVNPNYVRAWGSDLINLTLEIRFSGEKSNPFSFLWIAWDDTTVRNCAKATWGGPGWVITQPVNESDYELDRSAAVPDAGIMWLLGPALIGFGLIARRNSRVES